METRRRRAQLGKAMFREFGGEVRHGLFRGMKLAEASSWTPADLCPKLLGLYEVETVEVVSRLLKPGSTFINVGAGDGYFSIGFARTDLCDRVLAFELNPDGRNNIEAMAVANGVAEKVAVFGAADDSFAEVLREAGARLEGCVALIDIEGGEFSLLSDTLLASLAQTPMVVELHGGLARDGEIRERDLLARLRRVFDVSIYRTGARNFVDLPEVAKVSDDDRWLMASEGRPYLMEWAVCTPVGSTAPTRRERRRLARFNTR